MKDKQMKYPDTKAYEFAISYLESINVSIRDIAEIAHWNQEKYSDNTIEVYEQAVIRVLHKRVLLNHLMVMAFLDEASEKKIMPEPLQSIIYNDLGVFGVDETLAQGGSGIGDTLGITNYSYNDKVKPLKIGELDREQEKVTTFADDIVGMIAAVAIAHQVQKDS